MKMLKLEQDAFITRLVYLGQTFEKSKQEIREEEAGKTKELYKQIDSLVGELKISNTKILQLEEVIKGQQDLIRTFQQYNMNIGVGDEQSSNS